MCRIVRGNSPPVKIKTPAVKFSWSAADDVFCLHPSPFCSVEKRQIPGHAAGAVEHSLFYSCCPRHFFFKCLFGRVSIFLEESETFLPLTMCTCMFPDSY